MSVYARRRVAAARACWSLLLGGGYALATRAEARRAAASDGPTHRRSRRRAAPAAARSSLPCSRRAACALPTDDEGRGAVPRRQGQDGPARERQGHRPGRADVRRRPRPADPGRARGARSASTRVATFFVMGPEREVRIPTPSGALRGRHADRQPHLDAPAARPPDGEQAASELKQTQDEIASIIGVRPRFYRPPYWSWNYLTTARGRRSSA